MAHSSQAADELILRIYDAAQDRAQLPALLAALGRQFDAHTVFLRIHDAGHADCRYVQAVGWTVEEISARDAPFANRHPWRARGFQDMLMHGVGHEGTLISQRELVRTDYYHEVLAPMDARHGMGICLSATPPDHAVVISLNRSSRTGSFADDISVARRLLPHLRSAYAIMRRLSWAESHASSLASAIERLGVGLMLIDRAGRCTYRNAVADEAIGSPELSLTTSGHLSCADAGARLKLDAAIGLATRGALPAPQRIHVRDSTNVLRLVLVVTMLRGDAVSLGARGDASAAIFIHAPSRLPQQPEQILRDAFGLTRAEARLAALLSSGMDAARCADTLCVSKETIRTQVRGLFAKTRTHRQVELVSALEFVLRVR